MYDEALPTFSDVQYKPLRIWNRCVLFFNLMEDSGKAVAERYLKTLPKNEIKDMYAMYNRVLKEGRDKVYKEVTRDMPLQDPEDEYVH